jgi:hypothetical protein
VYATFIPADEILKARGIRQARREDSVRILSGRINLLFLLHEPVRSGFGITPK